MNLICPQCRNPIEVDAPADAEDIVCPSCGSTFSVRGALTGQWSSVKGKSLGRFVLESSIGSRGFGTVYRAHDPQLDRTIAIKVPRSGALGGAEDLDRFLHEGRSVPKLRHSGIVPVYEVGLADGVPYLVSEYVEGFSLDDVLTARELQARESAELVARVAEALHYAHGQGIVHRDVEPANILFEAQGDPRLVDFGLAKREAGEFTLAPGDQVLVALPQPPGHFFPDSQ